MNVVNVVPMRSPRTSPLKPSGTHIAVLEAAVLAALAPRPGGRYVDVTVGAGGHAAAVLRCEGTELLALDRDPVALRQSARHLARFGNRVAFERARFSELTQVLVERDIAEVDGIVADLGLSSMQLDEPSRGMSFRAEGPLDMRMDRSQGETALELIARVDDEELCEIIARLGEERRARRVARCIRQALEAGRLRTTVDLRRAVVRAVGPARPGGIDPATRTFQALRMAVNQELGELDALLEAAEAVVAPGGRLVVISFHSLEDRMVKRRLGDRGRWQPLTKKPVMPDGAERERNPRSRSAKLRAAERRAPEPRAEELS